MKRRGFIPRVLTLLATPIHVLSRGNYRISERVTVIPNMGQYITTWDKNIDIDDLVEQHILSAGYVKGPEGWELREWSCEVTFTDE